MLPVTQNSPINNLEASGVSLTCSFVVCLTGLLLSLDQSFYSPLPPLTFPNVGPSTASPAEHCQLCVGDEIVAVDGIAVAHLTYNQWRNKMASSLQTGSLTMDIRRHGIKGKCISGVFVSSNIISVWTSLSFTCVNQIGAAAAAVKRVIQTSLVRVG